MSTHDGDEKALRAASTMMPWLLHRDNAARGAPRSKMSLRSAHKDVRRARTGHLCEVWRTD